MSDTLPGKHRGAIRRGRGKSDLDPRQLAEIWLQQQREGKGLIGGDPARRPRWKHSAPPEPAPWYRHGLASPEHAQRLHEFLAAAPLEVEIGAGDGRFIVAWAQRHPNRHFLAFEVRWKYAHRMYERAQKRGLSNLWVSDNDARTVIPNLLPDESVEVFHILMPDPWWKPKHQAKRLLAPWFIGILARKLKPGGILRVETDVEGYPEFVEQIVTAHPLFAPHDAALGERFAQAEPTARQAWCMEKGYPIYRRYFRRKPSP
jgi:tRNA (guanine-N7-)-methyltransferase